MKSETANHGFQWRPCAPAAAAAPSHWLLGRGHVSKSGCISLPRGALLSRRKLSESRLGSCRQARGSLGGGRQGGVRVDREKERRALPGSPALRYLNYEGPGCPAKRARKRGASGGRPPTLLLAAAAPRQPGLHLGRRAARLSAGPAHPSRRGEAWAGPGGGGAGPRGAGQEPRQSAPPVAGPGSNSLRCTPDSVTSKGCPPPPLAGLKCEPSLAPRWSRQCASPPASTFPHVHSHPHFQGQRPGNPETSWRTGPLNLPFRRMRGVEHREKTTGHPQHPPPSIVSSPQVGEAPECSQAPVLGSTQLFGECPKG